jgi:hypothetical protein
VTPPPLPPHERAWRHPSELPAPRHEPPTRGGRILILSTAAVGLALVGVMAVRMTPGRGAPRDALVSVTTSSVIGELTELAPGSFGDVAGAATGTGRRFTDLLGRAFSSLLASTSSSPASATVRPIGHVVVTPIGSDGLGVTTAAAIAGRRGTISAMLPSGDIVGAELVGTRDGLALVELDEPGDSVAGPTITTPADEWTVVAFGTEFRVSDAELHSLAVPEAAPIFDADGDLVGLCTIGPDGVEMLPVERLPDVEAPTAGPPEPPAPATTEAAESTLPPASTPPEQPAPASTAPASTAATAATAATEPPRTTAVDSTDAVDTVASSEAVATSEAATSSVP